MVVQQLVFHPFSIECWEKEMIPQVCGQMELQQKTQSRILNLTTETFQLAIYMEICRFFIPLAGVCPMGDCLGASYGGATTGI